MKYSGSKWGLGHLTPGSMTVCVQEGVYDVESVMSYLSLKRNWSLTAKNKSIK